VSAEPGPADWTLPQLRIDREGEWFDGDQPVTHPGVLRHLREKLTRDAQGYFIQTRVRIPVEVADVPCVIVRLELRDDALHVTLSDGTEERIDPRTLRIAQGNVPYCRVRNGEFEARLSRAAAFQLLAVAEPDGVLRLGGCEYPLRRYAWTSARS
jgi:hypothetical protein